MRRTFRAIIGLESAAHVAPYYDVSGCIAATCMAERSPPARVGTGRADRAGQPPLGNAMALPAKRSRRFQRRPALLHDRRRHPRQARPYRRARPRTSICSPASTITPARTEGTLEIARRTGAQATIMKDLGHFPMSENPEKFIGYPLPVLEDIRNTRARSRLEECRRRMGCAHEISHARCYRSLHAPPSEEGGCGTARV